MLHFYPYLRQPFNYDCADDPWESGKPPFSPGHDAGGDVYKSNERSVTPWLFRSFSVSIVAAFSTCRPSLVESSCFFAHVLRIFSYLPAAVAQS